jgi:hypothetical protein
MCKHNSDNNDENQKENHKTTTTKPISQKPTQNENDDAFTQHAGEDESLASQDEEGSI